MQHFMAPGLDVFLYAREWKASRIQGRVIAANFSIRGGFRFQHVDLPGTEVNGEIVFRFKVRCLPGGGMFERFELWFGHGTFVRG